MNLMSILVLLFSFLNLILSRSYYGSQHVNGQTFSNDWLDTKLNSNRNMGGIYASKHIHPPHNSQETGHPFNNLKSGFPFKSHISNPTSADLQISSDNNKSDKTNREKSEDTSISPESVTKQNSVELNERHNSKSVNNTSLKAIAVIRGKVKGILYFEQIGEKVHITGSIEELTNGLHAFHVHHFGDLSRSCESSGDHFNPYNTKHGSPFDSVRHVGDLGNVFADEHGTARVDIKDTLLSLKGKNNILGHTIIVHENVDDLGRGGHVKSGRRIGCGIIGWRNDLE